MLNHALVVLSIKLPDNQRVSPSDEGIRTVAGHGGRLVETGFRLLIDVHCAILSFGACRPSSVENGRRFRRVNEVRLGSRKGRYILHRIGWLRVRRAPPLSLHNRRAQPLRIRAIWQRIGAYIPIRSLRPDNHS